MADSGVIKEFLVALGFKVDEVKLKKWDDAIAETTRNVGKFASVLEGMAALAATAVNKATERMENLYWFSKRVGSSSNDINAFAFALSRVGGSADEAKAAIKAISDFQKNVYAGPALLHSYGVKAEHLGDSLASLIDIAERWKKLPLPRVQQEAQILGISPETVYALDREWGHYYQEQRARLAKSGVDMDKAAAAAKFYQDSLKGLIEQVKIFTDKIILKLLPYAERIVEFFTKLHDETSGVSTSVAILVGALGPLVYLLGPLVTGIIALGAGLAALWADFQNWRSGASSLINWGEWAPDIDKALAALENLGGAFVELGKALGGLASDYWKRWGPAWKDFGHFLATVLTGGLNLIAGLIRIIAAALRGDWAAAWGEAVKTSKQGVADILANLKTGRKAIADFMFTQATGQPATATPGNPNTPSAQARARARAGAQAKASAANQNMPTGSGSTDQAIRYFMSQGWTREQAAGIVANLHAESGLNPHGPAGDSGLAVGIAQWHPDRQANFRRLYGKNIQDASLPEQLAFVQWELNNTHKRAGNALRNQNSASGAGSVVSRLYEAPKHVEAEAAARARAAEGLMRRPLTNGSGSGSQVSISQKTDIHVHGAKDPREAAQRVSTEQRRVNADLLRNTKNKVA